MGWWRDRQRDLAAGFAQVNIFDDGLTAKDIRKQDEDKTNRLIDDVATDVSQGGQNWQTWVAQSDMPKGFNDLKFLEDYAERHGDYTVGEDKEYLFMGTDGEIWGGINTANFNNPSDPFTADDMEGWINGMKDKPAKERDQLEAHLIKQAEAGNAAAVNTLALFKARGVFNYNLFDHASFSSDAVGDKVVFAAPNALFGVTDLITGDNRAERLSEYRQSQLSQGPSASASRHRGNVAGEVLFAAATGGVGTGAAKGVAAGASKVGLKNISKFFAPKQITATTVKDRIKQRALGIVSPHNIVREGVESGIYAARFYGETGEFDAIWEGAGAGLGLIIGGRYGKALAENLKVQQAAGRQIRKLIDETGAIGKKPAGVRRFADDLDDLEPSQADLDAIEAGDDAFDYAKSPELAEYEAELREVDQVLATNQRIKPETKKQLKQAIEAGDTQTLEQIVEGDKELQEQLRTIIDVEIKKDLMDGIARREAGGKLTPEEQVEVDRMKQELAAEFDDFAKYKVDDLAIPSKTATEAPVSSSKPKDGLKPKSEPKADTEAVDKVNKPPKAAKPTKAPTAKKVDKPPKVVKKKPASLNEPEVKASTNESKKAGSTPADKLEQVINKTEKEYLAKHPTVKRKRTNQKSSEGITLTPAERLRLDPSDAVVRDSISKRLDTTTISKAVKKTKSSKAAKKTKRSSPKANKQQADLDAVARGEPIKLNADGSPERLLIGYAPATVKGMVRDGKLPRRVYNPSKLSPSLQQGISTLESLGQSTFKKIGIKSGAYQSAQDTLLDTLNQGSKPKDIVNMALSLISPKHSEHISEMRRIIRSGSLKAAREFTSKHGVQIANSLTLEFFMDTLITQGKRLNLSAKELTLLQRKAKTIRQFSRSQAGVDLAIYNLYKVSGQNERLPDNVKLRMGSWKTWEDKSDIAKNTDTLVNDIEARLKEEPKFEFNDQWVKGSLKPVAKSRLTAAVERVGNIINDLPNSLKLEDGGLDLKALDTVAGKPYSFKLNQAYVEINQAIADIVPAGDFWKRVASNYQLGLLGSPTTAINVSGGNFINNLQYFSNLFTGVPRGITTKQFIENQRSIAGNIFGLLGRGEKGNALRERFKHVMRNYHSGAGSIHYINEAPTRLKTNIARKMFELTSGFAAAVMDNLDTAVRNIYRFEQTAATAESLLGKYASKENMSAIVDNLKIFHTSDSIELATKARKRYEEQVAEVVKKMQKQKVLGEVKPQQFSDYIDDFAGEKVDKIMLLDNTAMLGLAGKVSAWSKNIPGLNLVAPFGRTIINSLDINARHNPILGAGYSYLDAPQRINKMRKAFGLDEIRWNKKPTDATSQYIRAVHMQQSFNAAKSAQMTVLLGGIAATWAASQGYIAELQYPEAGAKREEWQREGKQPMGINYGKMLGIGDKWSSANFLNPFAPIFALGVTTNDYLNGSLGEHGVTGDLEEDAKNFIVSNALGNLNALSETPWFTTGSQLVRIVQSRGDNILETGSRVMGQYTSSFVPNLVKFISKATDPNTPEIDNFFKRSLLAHIPGIRNTLEDAEVLGHPVKRDFFDILLGGGNRLSYKEGDPVFKALDELLTINGVSKSNIQYEDVTMGSFKNQIKADTHEERNQIFKLLEVGDYKITNEEFNNLTDNYQINFYNQASKLIMTQSFQDASKQQKVDTLNGMSNDLKYLEVWNFLYQSPFQANVKSYSELSTSQRAYLEGKENPWKIKVAGQTSSGTYRRRSAILQGITFKKPSSGGSAFRTVYGRGR